MTCVFPLESEVIRGVRFGEIPPLTVDSTLHTIDSTQLTADLTEWGQLPFVGNYDPAPEARVELNFAYGSNSTQYVGTLVAGGGGVVHPDAPVDGYGQIRSPLQIGRQYTEAVGTAFVWQIDSANDLRLLDVRLVSRMAQRCGGSYDYDLPARVAEVTPGVYEVVVDFTDTQNTSLHPGWYNWWLIATDSLGNDIQLASGRNLWLSA